MLEANRLILEQQKTEIENSVKIDNETKITGTVKIGAKSEIINSKIRGPVIIGENCKILNSFIGPFTSIYHNVEIKDSEVEYSIIHEDCKLIKVNRRIENSLLGKGVTIATLLANPYSSWSNEKSEKTLRAGIQAVFDYDLIKAETIFDQLIEYEPNRPEGYYYKSYVYFWRYFISEKKVDYDKFSLYSGNAVKQTELYLEREKNIPVREALAYFFLGESYTYRAAVEARAGNFISAGWNGTKARQAYEDALEKKPNFEDAKKGKGMFQFVISLIPGSLKWIVEALGYEGDRYGGLQLMKDAKEKGYYVQKELEYYLIVIDFYFFKKREEAEVALLKLLSKSPNSSLYLYTLGYLYYSRANFDLAIQKFEKCVENLKRDKNDAFVTYSLYMIAETYFYRNNFKEALSYFLKTSNVRELEFFMARTHYAIGVCYEMLGERAKAIDFFSNAKVRIDVISGELYAKRKSREYAVTPMTAIQKKLLRLSNFVSLGKSDEANQLLKELENARLSKDETAELQYNIGKNLKNMGRLEEAIAVLKNVGSMFPIKERHFPPLSRLELAKIYMSQNKLDLAEEELSKAEKYTSYDYEVTVRREVSLIRDETRRK
ncbi:hypothetical protein CHS0354_023861 [Potamilus streckersoni]|uniref:Tetratricopeptide repeat protein n=1 Tax=Potamilus streckersoni TaxID=2493646 RepID=A0AAE0RZD8_9BIVA|nr:hypothetical protein CHS0354_023861 [Potamilus streckersoni]